MGIIEILGGIGIIVMSVIVIAAVTVQEGSKGGLGVIGGGDSGSFFDKNRGKTKEAMLVRATAICGTVMAVLVVVVLIASR